MITFYQTPIGQKLAHEQPLMAQESMTIGQKWGMELGQKIMTRLRDKGYSKT